MKSEKQIVEYIKLRPKQLLGRRKEMPVAYIGLGILEWHGLHNPLGLDGLKADGVAVYLAEKLGGVVMPPQFWGDNRSDICELVFNPEVSGLVSFDHTKNIISEMKLKKKDFMEDAKRSKKNGSWENWENIMVHTFFQIQTLGFKAIIPIPGHYPLFIPLDNAIEKYKNQGGKCQVFSIRDDMYDKDYPGDHGAKFETSLMMALSPELVDMKQLDDDTNNPNWGVLGDDPRIYASEEYGRKILKKFEVIAGDFIRKTI